MSEYIDTVFGPKGILARRFDGYAPRSGQIEMARSVDAALREGRHLLAEAPTGTGKGIAYGVPATYHAVKHKRRVVMVTANIALQEQLVGKDLPKLAEILPWDFSFALLKGKSNYLCHDRRYQEEAEGTLHLLDDPADAQRLDDLIAWARDTQAGDVSELPFKPEYRLWRRFSTTSDDCKGSDCTFLDQCCSARAKAIAQDAHVVVTNYHLLCAHLQVKEATGEDLVLPSFDVAILDAQTMELRDPVRGGGNYLGGLRLQWTGTELELAQFDLFPAQRITRDFIGRMYEETPLDWLLDGTADARPRALLSEEDILPDD
jgi:ATP-dependent DNA helicase DinG